MFTWCIGSRIATAFMHIHPTKADRVACMQTERVTIYDVAREAGVSPSTVPRVLSGRSNVNALTRGRVQAVIDKHSFTPSSLAQGLLQKNTRTLGIILPGVEHPYYASMFTGAHSEAQRLGYALQLFPIRPQETMTKPFMELIDKRRLDGVILSGGVVEAILNDGLVSQLQQLLRAIPAVAVCPPIPGLNCINIYSDLTSSVRQSLRHLYTLGHRRIAFLGGSYESRSAGERELGFIDEAEHLGLPSRYRNEAGHSPQAGETGVIKLLNPLPKGEWPTALLCINDLVALGAMRQLRRMQINIPAEMAIVGCDNQFFSSYTCPPLTTVDLHPDEHGRAAIQQLVSSIGREHITFSQLQPATLIVRESCGAALGFRKFP